MGCLCVVGNRSCGLGLSSYAHIDESGSVSVGPFGMRQLVDAISLVCPSIKTCKGGLFVEHFYLRHSLRGDVADWFLVVRMWNELAISWVYGDSVCG